MTIYNLPGPMLLLFGLILMFLVVPWKRIKELALIGLTGGLIVAFALIYLMQNVLGRWIFYNVDLLYIIKIPLFLSASWFPFIVVFSHLLSQYKDLPLILITLAALPVGATAIHLFLLNTGMLTYHNWNLAFTFLLSLGIHIAITLYLYLSGQISNLKTET